MALEALGSISYSSGLSCSAYLHKHVRYLHTLSQQGLQASVASASGVVGSLQAWSCLAPQQQSESYPPLIAQQIGRGVNQSLASLALRQVGHGGPLSNALWISSATWGCGPPFRESFINGDYREIY